MAYSGYRDKEKRKEYLRKKMREYREHERVPVVFPEIDNELRQQSTSLPASRGTYESLLIAKGICEKVKKIE